MTKESLEALRERLIRDERVRQMIRVRAYEIYQMRGPHSGGQAQDWFQAEDEILAFLIADESHRAEERETKQQRRDSIPPVAGQQEGTPLKKSKPRRAATSQPTTKSAAKPASSKKATGGNSKPRRSRKQSKPETAQ